MKVLLATNNQGKVERFKGLFQSFKPDAEIYSPSDLNIEVIDVEEDGETLKDNAILKARAYLGKVDMPILANDTGFYVEGEGFVSAPKREALGDTKEHQLTSEEMSEKILNFWKGIATKHGGEVDAAWIEVFAAVYPDGSVKTAESRREITLTDIEHGKAHPQMPVRALYHSKATGKPAILHTTEEEIVEMKPVIEAIKEVVK